MKKIIIRPFYGININGDMAGDLGIVDYSVQVLPDLSIVYSYSLAKQYDDEIDVLDCNAEKRLATEVIKNLNWEQYSEIFVKITAPTITEDLLFCEAVKKIKKDIKISVFGHMAQLLKPWLEKNDTTIDEIIEEPLDVKLYRTYRNKECKGDLLNQIPNLYYKDLPYYKYTNGKDRVGFLWASRGCSLNCDYCPYQEYYKGQIIYRREELVIKDVKELEKLDVSYIQFRDPIFTLGKERVKKICKLMIESKVKTRWMCETKIEMLDSKLIEIMSKAGCDLIAFGIESSNSKAMDSHGRKWHEFEMAKRNVELCQKNGIQTLAFYMLGFEDDTWTSLENTYKLSCYINSTQAQFNIFTVYPWNSKDGLVQPDLFVPGENLTNIKACHLITKEEIKNIAEYFTMEYKKRFFNLETIMKEKEYKKLIRLRSKKIFEQEKEKMLEILKMKKQL